MARERPTAIGVRGVLAAAYRGKDLEDRALLTHAAELDARGDESRALCRVPVDSLCDDPVYAAPTCPVCAKRAAR